MSLPYLGPVHYQGDRRFEAKIRLNEAESTEFGRSKFETDLRS
jgi:hypothetical protein